MRYQNLPKGVCYLAANSCGLISYGSINADSCTTGGKCIETLSTTIDEVVISICQRYQGLDCPDVENSVSAAVFTRSVTYEIYLINGECILNNLYQDDSCLKINDNKCIICKQDSYPNQFQIFEYLKDKVEAFFLHSSETNIDNCIVYNSVDRECLRCQDGYGVLQTNKQCIDCSAKDKVKSYNELNCLNFEFLEEFDLDNEVIDKGLCMKVSIKEDGSYYCLRCEPEYAPEFNLAVAKYYEEIDYVWINEERSFIPRSIQSFEVLLCQLYDTSFFHPTYDRDLITNCEWGIKIEETFYCQSCKFGNLGFLSQTALEVNYIEGCETTQICNTERVVIIEPYIANFISCHFCATEGNLPTIKYYFEKYASKDIMNFHYYNPFPDLDQILRPFECQVKEIHIPDNCLIQMKIFEENLKTKVIEEIEDNYSTSQRRNGDFDFDGSTDFDICLVCKPMYKPTYLTLTDEIYPFKFTMECDSISYCATSVVANICEECFEYYQINEDGTVCTVDEVTDTTRYCEELNYDNDNDIIGCNMCKTGYVFTD